MRAREKNYYSNQWGLAHTHTHGKTYNIAKYKLTENKYISTLLLSDICFLIP